MNKIFCHTLLLLVSSYLTSACTMAPTSVSRSPIPETQWQGPLPDIAAEFRTTLRTMRKVAADAPPHHETDSPTKAHTETQQWRIWRKSHELIRENLTGNTADQWHQDGNTLIQKTYFHHDRRGVEFQQADLQMMNTQPRWQSLQLVFDPELLGKLKMTEAGWHDGVPFQRYEGTLEGSQWRLEVRTDLMLPLQIERQTEHARETITLVNAFPLTQAPWQPVPTHNYNVIDFADIGDMESDPFVKKIEAQLGGVHHH